MGFSRSRSERRWCPQRYRLPERIEGSFRLSSKHPDEPSFDPQPALGEEPDRVSAEFRKRVRVDLAAQDWYSRFDEDSLRWFRDRFGAGPDDGRDPYERMSAEAATVPAGSEGAFWAPYLMGERTPHLDPFARAARSPW